MRDDIETNVAGYTSKVLNCKGAEPLSSAILTFSNGKLNSKSQFGLASSSNEVKGSMTLAKFNLMQLGRHPAEVQAITGPCEKIFRDKCRRLYGLHSDMQCEQRNRKRHSGVQR